MRTSTYILVVLSLVGLCSAIAFSQEKSREKKEDRQYDGKLRMKGDGGKTGTLLFSKVSTNCFHGKIILKGLKHSNDYVLTINSKPGKRGEFAKEVLKEFGEFNDESYYDVTEITTDEEGNYEGEFDTDELPPGKYYVKFLVKDKDDSWRVILNNDKLFFTIKEPEKK